MKSRCILTNTIRCSMLDNDQLWLGSKICFVQVKVLLSFPSKRDWRDSNENKQYAGFDTGGRVLYIFHIGRGRTFSPIESFPPRKSRTCPHLTNNDFASNRRACLSTNPSPSWVCTRKIMLLPSCVQVH